MNNTYCTSIYLNLANGSLASAAAGSLQADETDVTMQKNIGKKKNLGIKGYLQHRINYTPLHLYKYVDWT